MNLVVENSLFFDLLLYLMPNPVATSLLLLLVVAAAGAVAVEAADALLLFGFYAVGRKIGAGVYNKAARDENLKKENSKRCK